MQNTENLPHRPPISPTRGTEEELLSTIKRGIAPKILLDHVENTIPFLFHDDTALPKATEHLELLRKWKKSLKTDPSSADGLTHVEYFELCMAAHNATTCSFVPTDVDNQIRFRLWHPGLPTETILAMTEVVLRSFEWDFRPVSRRWIESPIDDRPLNVHDGGWFSFAVGAYSALRRRSPTSACEILHLMGTEVERECRIYEEFERRRDGIGMLKAATIIAHNLGDLDRVAEMWQVTGTEDELCVWLNLGHEVKNPKLAGLKRAGDLNKEMMAAENHRHFPMRKPRALRRSPSLLLPISPFLDEWGRRLVRDPALTPSDLGEIIEAAVDGTERLKCVGYLRALSGMESVFPGGLDGMASLVPAKIGRQLKSGSLRTQTSVSQERFEAQWATRGNRLRPR